MYARRPPWPRTGNGMIAGHGFSVFPDVERSAQDGGPLTPSVDRSERIHRLT